MTKPCPLVKLKVMDNGFPIKSLPRPRTGSIKQSAFAVAPLAGSLEPTQGREAYEQALVQWGFSQLPGVQPTANAGSTLWAHPAGVLLVDEAFCDPPLTTEGACHLMTMVDMGFYHNDNNTPRAHHGDHVIRLESKLASGLDGRSYQVLYAQCRPFAAPACLHGLQELGRLASFDQQAQVGPLLSGSSRKSLLNSAPTWKITPDQVPSELKALLGWLMKGAKVSEDAKDAISKAGAMLSMVRNQAKAEKSRYGKRNEGLQRSVWALQATGQVDFKPVYTVHTGGLTQAACLAAAVKIQGNAKRLAQWVQAAPVAALEAAVRGNPPTTPCLMGLVLDGMRQLPEQDAHESLGHLVLAWSSLAERLGGELLSQVWEQNELWGVIAETTAAATLRVPAHHGLNLARLAMASEEAGMPWPEPDELVWKRLREGRWSDKNGSLRQGAKWSDDHLQPLLTVFKHRRLGAALEESQPAVSRRPRL